MKVIIAGGGTGGHLFPGVAVAERLIAKNKKNEVLFVGKMGGIEVEILPRLGFSLKIMDVSGIMGLGTREKIGSILKMLFSMRQAISVIRDFGPDLVVGMGGYVSGPFVLAAYVLRKKIAILEQNLVPGLTNKILANLADRVFVSFPDTKIFFPDKKTIFTGNPVRMSFLESAEEEGSRLKAQSPKPKAQSPKLSLLILGGSQGAHFLNKIMVECLTHFQCPALSKERAGQCIENDLSITHQTGKDDFEWVREEYQKHGIESLITPFIDDIPEALRNSDLVVSRAGATIISEICVMGRPSILIPFPHASKDHQTANAKYMVDGNASIMFKQDGLTSKTFSRSILSIKEKPDLLKEMGENARKLARPAAADDVVDECYRLVNRLS